MKYSSWLRIRGPLSLLAALFPLVTASASAAPLQADAAVEIEARPIECWWKTDKTGVHVAEQFRLTLTCRIVQSNRVSVIPAFSQLEPGAVQLAPFEVLDGVRHEDITAGIWRYFQYQYTLRLIAEDAFGQDIPIPPLSVAYNIQMEQDGTAQQGRERTYLLPVLPIRIVSLVPNLTSDIRDVSSETFADIMAREKRATRAMVAAIVCFSFAAVCLMLAAAKLMSRYRARRPVAARLLSAGMLVHGSLKQLQKVQAATAGSGWTPESLGRALAACRVAAAVAMEKPVAQQLATGGATARDGQLLLSKGLLTRQSVLVSGAATPQSISRWLAAPASRRAPIRAAVLLPEIRELLVVFSNARYGRSEELDNATLQRSLTRAIEVLQRLRFAVLWPAWKANGQGRTAAYPGAVVWSR